MKLNFVDVFSGAGGFSCGLELAGMNCILGVDNNKHAIDTFKENHTNAATFCGSIQDLTKSKLLTLINNKKVHAVVGGPPCQGFSTIGPGNPKDIRNKLFLEFVRLVKITNPEFIVIENVTGIVAKKNEKTLKEIFSYFNKLGYNLDFQVMSAELYGVPEKRKRTIIIGSRVNQTILFPKPSTKIKTVGDAIKNLKTKSGKILNHEIKLAEIKSKIDKKIIKYIPEGKGIRYQEDEINYLPRSLKLGVDWINLRENRFRQTKYKRLDRKTPGPTIMTHRHSYYHPTENRYLTQREAAAIQSFPNSFKFLGPLSAQWRQIGNAVPPVLAKKIGKEIIKMYNNGSPTNVVQLSTKKTINETINKIRERAFSYKNSRP